MSQRSDRVIRELAGLADAVGPALAPVGYDELLLSIIEAARRLFDAAACSLALLDEQTDELVEKCERARGRIEESPCGLDDRKQQFVVPHGC